MKGVLLGGGGICPTMVDEAQQRLDIEHLKHLSLYLSHVLLIAIKDEASLLK